MHAMKPYVTDRSLRRAALVSLIAWASNGSQSLLHFLNYLGSRLELMDEIFVSSLKLNFLHGFSLDIARRVIWRIIAYEGRGNCVSGMRERRERHP